MKVVLFCGGLGLRMRTHVDSAPKPMMSIGDRPVLWHIMRYFAHFGHTEFILCLGYGASSVKDYFLRYDETQSNDFVLTRALSTSRCSSPTSPTGASRSSTPASTPPSGSVCAGSVTCSTMTRCSSPTTATSSPTLQWTGSSRTSWPRTTSASLLAVPPQASFHVVGVDGDSQVTEITQVATMPMWINGGYFVLRQSIFDVLHQDEDLVEDAFARLAAVGRLAAVPYHGFWAPMDTLKERSTLEALDRSGEAPWKLWAKNTDHGSRHNPEAPSAVGDLVLEWA